MTNDGCCTLHDYFVINELYSLPAIFMHSRLLLSGVKGA
jgi:hypothetical protein